MLRTSSGENVYGEHQPGSTPRKVAGIPKVSGLRRPNTRRRSSLSNVKPAAPEEVVIGARVSVAPDFQRTGVVKFKGETQFKEGEWVGIELDAKYPGKNNGEVQDVFYFNCKPGQGIFILSDKLALEKPTSSSPLTQSPMGKAPPPKPPTSPKPKLKAGLTKKAPPPKPKSPKPPMSSVMMIANPPKIAAKASPNKLPRRKSLLPKPEPQTPVVIGTSTKETDQKSLSGSAPDTSHAKKDALQLTRESSKKNLLTRTGTFSVIKPEVAVPNTSEEKGTRKEDKGEKEKDDESKEEAKEEEEGSLLTRTGTFSIIKPETQSEEGAGKELQDNTSEDGEEIDIIASKETNIDPDIDQSTTMASAKVNNNVEASESGKEEPAPYALLAVDVKEGDSNDFRRQVLKGMSSAALTFMEKRMSNATIDMSRSSSMMSLRTAPDDSDDDGSDSELDEVTLRRKLESAQQLNAEMAPILEATTRRVQKLTKLLAHKDKRINLSVATYEDLIADLKDQNSVLEAQIEKSKHNSVNATTDEEKASARAEVDMLMQRLEVTQRELKNFRRKASQDDVMGQIIKITELERKLQEQAQEHEQTVKNLKETIASSEAEIMQLRESFKAQPKRRQSTMQKRASTQIAPPTWAGINNILTSKNPVVVSVLSEQLDTALAIQLTSLQGRIEELEAQQKESSPAILEATEECDGAAMDNFDSDESFF